MSEPRPAARGLAAAVAEEFSFEESLGGVRGMIESVVPILVFSITYLATHALWPACAASIGVSVLTLLVRLATRKPVMPAVSGLLGVAVSAGIALLSGHAVAYFAGPIAKNILFAVLFAGSAVAGWPLVGVMLGLILKEQFHWREVPARRRVYQQATWLWVAMSLIRLAVEIPLYLRNDVAMLAAASVPLGVPLYGLVLLGTWLIVRRVPVARPPEPDPQPESESEGATSESATSESATSEDASAPS